MDIKRMGDLIVDEYGNYYHVVDKKDDTLILVNAFMELSFRRRLDDIYIEEHKGEYVGARALQIMKSVIERIHAKKTSLKMIALKDLEKEYDIVIENLFERT
ncbi:MAG TPA: hypothetical protein VFK37_08085 [Bacillales bacterium]|nr:hypothetical protein [Bacillales bacterium]